MFENFNEIRKHFYQIYIKLVLQYSKRIKLYTMSDMKALVEQHKDQFLAELFELLRIPSVSADPKYKEDVLRAANSVRAKVRGYFYPFWWARNRTGNTIIPKLMITLGKISTKLIH